MDAHKYLIGQSVIYRPPRAYAPQGDYVIMARLPQRDDGKFDTGSNIRTSSTNGTPKRANCGLSELLQCRRLATAALQ